MTTTTTGCRRLLTSGTTVLALLLLILGTVLMHSVIGADEHAAHTGTAIGVSNGGHTTDEHAALGSFAGNAAAPTRATVPVLTAMGVGSAGPRELMCAGMGMACVIVIALFAWALHPVRAGGLLHLLARLIALAAQVPRRVAVPRPPSLTALQILRT
ncbi:hypothetical protein [Luteimicrobium sp. DT211]|uniref:hypothetical protein n=1 Tax=Luteimicrobium sp. DT211 TaxID=3393412 RepID=UPI003CF60EA2